MTLPEEILLLDLITDFFTSDDASTEEPKEGYVVIKFLVKFLIQFDVTMLWYKKMTNIVLSHTSKLP